MECNENGRKCKISTSNRRGVKRKRRGSGEGGVHLAFTSSVPKAACPLPMRINLVPHYPPELATDTPFMNNMDEISYWVYTKRAPCLLNYDNVLKRQAEQAHCSKTKPSSVQSPCEKTPTSKKKKRKLKLLVDDSVSTEKQQNIYFSTTQNQKQVVSTCKSDLVSNVEFNIKSSPQNTPKRTKLQKNCRSQKKKARNKPATSTPKVAILRRSLRKAQKNNNNSQLNDSLQIFDTSLINGKEEDGQHRDEYKEELVASGDQGGSKIPEKEKKNVLNGQFEDLSDVSGFTANYIRSTKIQSTKTPRKLRNRNSRNLIKDNKHVSPEDKMVVCVNKSINAMPEAVLNSSTDSSQNVINLVTLKSNDRSNKVNKSTSLLKFMDSKLDKSQKNNKAKKANLNVSFQTKSSGSRYPKRHKNNVIEQNCSQTTSATLRHSTRKTKLNDSHKKENSEERITSRTRSGRKIGVKLDFTETGSPVVNNSSEQMSSSALNVANPKTRGRNTNNTSTRCLRSRQDKRGLLSKDSSSESEKKIQSQSRVKKSIEKTLKRDSVRNKSGFAACFSESGSESEPLKQRKFFF